MKTIHDEFMVWYNRELPRLLDTDAFESAFMAGVELALNDITGVLGTKRGEEIEVFKKRCATTKRHFLHGYTDEEKAATIENL